MVAKRCFASEMRTCLMGLEIGQVELREYIGIAKQNQQKKAISGIMLTESRSFGNHLCQLQILNKGGEKK